jgi:hypothetical protein
MAMELESGSIEAQRQCGLMQTVRLTTRKAFPSGRIEVDGRLSTNQSCLTDHPHLQQPTCRSPIAIIPQHPVGSFCCISQKRAFFPQRDLPVGWNPNTALWTMRRNS